MPRTASLRRSTTTRTRVCVVILAFLVSPLALQALTLKIGTLAPSGSPWVDALKQLAGDWERLSGGQVKLRIFAGGVAGEESDMVRKMRIGQLHGAALTQLGLSELAPGILAFSVPFMIQSDDEFEYVLQRARPHFEARIAEQEFRLLALLGAGWVHFFATQRLVYPDDLKHMKLGVPAGDDVFIAAWRKMGFEAVSLPISDLLAGLQTGMIDAFYSPLLAAASFQWFHVARHVTGLEIAPVVTGIVIPTRHFERIPEDLRPVLMERLALLEEELQVQTDRLDREATRVMQKHGLIVDEVPPEAVEQWKLLGSTGVSEVIGKSFTRESHTLLRGYLAEYRQQQTSSGQ